MRVNFSFFHSVSKTQSQFLRWLPSWTTVDYPKVQYLLKSNSKGTDNHKAYFIELEVTDGINGKSLSVVRQETRLSNRWTIEVSIKLRLSCQESDKYPQIRSSNPKLFFPFMKSSFQRKLISCQ